jgi:hypothetical protein
MDKDDIKYITGEYSPRSGKIAVDLGFVTPEQIKEALTEQIEDDLSSRPHRFLGQILLDKGWITEEQADILLDALLKARKRKD